MTSEVRVRFAPSPTGYMHVGNVRSALFNYLLARHHGGKFILRIEDTDRSRFQEDALREIFESLRWLGLDWDEGPEKDGDVGPYFQSERIDLYKKHAGRLVEAGHAYYCFCTPQRLRKMREEQEQAGMPRVSGYDGHCRDLPADEARARVERGEDHVVRLKIPYDANVVFKDVIRGHIEYKTEVIEDFVIMKSDGFPTYHLANVIDDHFMRISHVMRGDEWITSTPKHVLMYEAFGWEPPVFAHLPVILASNGGKLSKRKGAASVSDFRNGGYLPEALFNFLVLLGWSPGDDREKMERHEIIEAFSLDQVSAKSSVFDEKKLEWMNGLYMHERSVDSLVPDVLRLLKEKGHVPEQTGPDDARVRTVVGLMKNRSKRINDIADSSAYFFHDPKEYEDKAVKKHFKSGAADTLRMLAGKFREVEAFDKESLEKLFREHVEETGISAGKLIHPTRLAVSGVGFGPGLFELVEALGRETVLRRMKSAVAWLENRETTQGRSQEGNGKG